MSESGSSESGQWVDAESSDEEITRGIADLTTHSEEEQVDRNSDSDSSQNECPCVEEDKKKFYVGSGAFMGPFCPVPRGTSHQLEKIDEDLQRSELERHNHYRSLHGVDDLIYDENIAAFAQTYAENLAAKMRDGGGLEHNSVQIRHHGLGENIYSSTGIKEEAAGAATDAWYSEIKDYKSKGNVPSNDPATGHFTQVVWKWTERAGFGIAKFGKNSIIVVGNYYPAGNMTGDNNKYFFQNVLMP